MIGKLEPAVLQELWKHEALHFTSWLAENCDVLNDQLGLDLTVIETEKSVGPFRADIFAKDGLGRLVIIENQLGRTDHDHLGKLLTYLSNLDAKVAIWITSDPRPEHVTAIEFLNENVPSDTQFYLVKLQAFRIGDSHPAPLFTIEAGPSEERTAGGTIKKEFAEKDKRRFEFFKQLLDLCNRKTALFGNISPVDYQNSIHAGAGRSGLSWAFNVSERATSVVLFFSASNAELSRRRYESLFAQKAEIEATFGEPLFWDFKEGRRQQYVRSFSPEGGMENLEKWRRIQEDLAERLVRIEAAFRFAINDLD